MQKIEDFGEWLFNYIPSKPKRDTQSKSTLKNFAIQYQIRGLYGYDP